MITLPTREIGSSSTLIDNIYTNIPEPNLTGLSGVLNTIRTTDHYPIFTIRYNTHCKNTLSYRNRRNFNNDSISKLRKILKSHNWNNIYRYDNAQTAYTHFNAFIVAKFENCFPKHTVKITYKNRCEWIDQNLKNDIARRETLFVKKQKYPTEENV